MSVKLDLGRLESFLQQEELAAHTARAAQISRQLLACGDTDGVLGWRTLEHSALQLDLIRQKAEEIRRDADAFVIVGVGGSNQAARAMIEALEDRDGPEIIYLGNTLSPYYISHTLKNWKARASTSTSSPKTLRRWNRAAISAFCASG